MGSGESLLQSSHHGVETSPFTSTTWRTLRWNLKWSSRELWCLYLQEQMTMMEMGLVQMYLMVEQEADYSMMSMRTTATLQP